jgi:hypothetical protein
VASGAGLDLHHVGRPVASVARQWRSLFGAAILALMATPIRAQSLTFNEHAIRFGSVGVHNTSAMKIVAISNTTDQSFFLSEIVTTSELEQTNNCSNWLGSGSACLAFVKFRPTIAGPRSGELIVRAVQQREQAISLSGVGAQPSDDRTATTTSSTRTVSCHVSQRRVRARPEGHPPVVTTLEASV